jgi:hypothetical protein
LTITCYSARRSEGHHAMDSLPTGSIQSWVIVAVVALSPVIVLFLSVSIGLVRPGRGRELPPDSTGRQVE